MWVPWMGLRLILLVALVTYLQGCVVSYQHYSDPRIANDGRDLICLGAEHDVQYLRLRADACRGVDSVGGGLAHIAIEYRFNKRVDKR
jgi:hypothetical protein